MCSTTSFCLYIVVILTISSSSVVLSQLCPSGSHTFSTGVCLTLSSSLSSFSQASTGCQSSGRGGNLITVSTNGQLLALRGYVRSLGAEGNQYWTGYQYNGNQLTSSIDGSIAPSFVTSNVLSNGLSGANGVCVAILRNGTLINEQCSTSLNGYLCQFTTTSPTVSDVKVNDTLIDPSSPQTQPLGLSLSLSCDFTNTTSSSTVQWTLDGTVLVNNERGATIMTSSDKSNSVLSLSRFLQAGVYTCKVTNSDGRSAEERIQLYGSVDDILFVPGPLSVSGFISLPNTNSSLLIQWFPPQLSFVPSPLLLQYTLYYSTDSTADTGTSQSISGLTTDPTTGIGSYILTDLSPGTVYYLRMRASNEAGDGEILQSILQARTFGIAPRDAPSNLKLSRNEANSALLADWDDVMTTPPTGEVLFNQIEFRDRGSRTVNILFVDNQFSFASIFNVSNAVSYEVRVRSAVQSTRDPVTYVYGPYTGWVSVTGIATAIPSVPTIQPVTDRSLDNTLTIAVSVVVPIVVIIIVIIVAIVCVVCIVSYSKSKNEYTDGGASSSPRRATNKVSSDMSLPPQGEKGGEKEQIL